MLSLASGGNLNSWPVLVVSPPWGGGWGLFGGGGVRIWLMKNSSNWTHTGSFSFQRFVWLSKGFLEEKSTADLRLRSQLLWSCLLYVGIPDRHLVSNPRCVMFKWDQEFTDLTVCVFCGKTEETTTETVGLDETNLYCNNRVFLTVCALYFLRSQIKLNPLMRIIKYIKLKQ